MSSLVAFDPEDFPSFVNVNVPSTLHTALPSNWCVASTGDAARDIALGSTLANEAITYSRRMSCSNTIVFAVAEIGRRGHLGWVELAFLDRIARAARAGVCN